MLDLSPTKLLVILVVAVVIVGPQRLPRAAREVARHWRRLREAHAEIEREVRRSIPSLPPELDLVRYARSPVALLNRLADAVPSESGETLGDEGAGSHAIDDGRRPATVQMTFVDDDPNVN